MSCEYLVKCDEGDLPELENMYENHSYGASSTKDMFHFKKVSEKVNEYEMKNEKPNFCEKEGTLQGKVCPIAVVAVPPAVRKREELGDRCESHTLSPHFPTDNTYDNDVTQEIHMKDKLDGPSSLEFKLEVKDEILSDETIGSDYCEYDLVEESGAVEIKSESICDIKEEKPITTCLDEEKFEDDSSEQSGLKKETLECEAEKSSFIGDQQDINGKFILGNGNELKKEDIYVIELISASNSFEESRHNSTTVDETSGFSNSRVDLKMKGKGLKTNSFSYICSTCNVVFSSKTLYEQFLLSRSEHMDRLSQICFQRITFSCPICKKPFSEKKMMNFKPSVGKKEKLFPCGMCERSFCFKAIRDRHLQTHSIEERLHCNVCKKSFSTPVKHYKHMQSHSVEENVECDFNEKILSVKSKLEAHMNSRSGENSLECGVCHKTLSGREALKVHMGTHTGEKPFFCAICNNSFTTKDGLTLHTQIHTGFRPFACDLCPKSFNSKTTLRVHKQSHTGKKIYKCEVCTESFSDRPLLKEHMQMHPVKPIPCNLCDKSYSSKSGLYIHMRTHTAEKHYKCEFCNKSFFVYSKMRIHRRTHTGEKPYLCKICNKSFSHKSSHKRHVQLHTGENPDV